MVICNNAIPDVLFIHQPEPARLGTLPLPQPPCRLQVAPWGDEPRELHLCGASIGLQRACHRHSHVECHATRILVRSWGCGSFGKHGQTHKWVVKGKDGVTLKIGFVNLFVGSFATRWSYFAAFIQAIGATLASGSLRNYLHCVRH